MWQGSGYLGLMQKQRFNGRKFCISPTDCFRHSRSWGRSAVKGSFRQTALTSECPWLAFRTAPRRKSQAELKELELCQWWHRMSRKNDGQNLLVSQFPWWEVQHWTLRMLLRFKYFFSPLLAASSEIGYSSAKYRLYFAQQKLRLTKIQIFLFV